MLKNNNDMSLNAFGCIKSQCFRITMNSNVFWMQFLLNQLDDWSSHVNFFTKSVETINGSVGDQLRSHVIVECQFLYR